VAHWATSDVVRLLKTGLSPQSAVLGPMAEVVFNSTQYLRDDDLQAIAVFLQQLPPAAPAASDSNEPDASAAARGAVIYKDHCTACHGAQGEGAAGAYPALAGNRKLTMVQAANLVHVVLEGGFAPATQGNPRPYGMPPFGQRLSNAQVADVVSYIRSSWGNRGAPVSEIDVIHVR
jgi:mono/diheme cytochrome c family protein